MTGANYPIQNNPDPNGAWTVLIWMIVGAVATLLLIDLLQR